MLTVCTVKKGKYGKGSVLRVEELYCTSMPKHSHISSYRRIAFLIYYYTPHLSHFLLYEKIFLNIFFLSACKPAEPVHNLLDKLRGRQGTWQCNGFSGVFAEIGSS
jgi:hypothetical protein